MTREEAIKILQGAIKKPNTKDGYLGQALDMAIKALEQEPKTEAVKTTIIQELKDHFIEPEDAGLTIKGEYWLAREVLAIIEETEPKTGRWIEHPHEAGPCWEYSRYECSECHEWAEDDSDYCPNCGFRMIEPQERSSEE